MRARLQNTQGLVHIAILVLAVVATCKAEAGDPMDERAIRAFLMRLEAAPPWTTPPWKREKGPADPLEALGREFQKFSPAQARLIVERFSAFAMRRVGDGAGEIDEHSKLFVLLRFYFDVPATEKRRAGQNSGGWFGWPLNDDADEYLLWPLSATDGTLHITGVCQGYLGEPYNAVGEFEFFASRFQRRQTPAK